jgi:DNA-directed RNA polymerase specialized sigma24 family protein
MPERAALLEAQIPGLRRFACALLRGDRERADDLVQDTLERALSRWHLRRAEGDLRGCRRDQLPRKFGLRLAWNASTPSRKSLELRSRL